MQTNGEVELQQYVVGGGPNSHNIFKLSSEVPTLSSSTPAHGHHLHHPHTYSPHIIHHHHHTQQQQQQSHLHNALHHAARYHHAQPQASSTQPQHSLLQAAQQQLLQEQHHRMQQLAVISDILPQNISSPAANQSSKALVAAAEEINNNEEVTEEEEERGTALSGGNRWPRQETLALLKIRSDMGAIFRDSSLKGPLWEEVSRKLAEAGYRRSAKKCKEKFENVHKYYRRTKCSKTGKQDGKIYRFHNQLEALYGVANVSASKNNTLPSAAAAANTTDLTTPHNGDKIGFLIPRSNSIPSGERTPNLHYSSDINLSPGSSEDAHENPSKAQNTENRKKRKHGDQFVQFMETLMHKVLERQEHMQQKFLEALEKREHDRIVREEAWRKQEIARMTKEHEMRAQERAFAAARDAALIAFLQKVSGQPFEVSQAAITSHCVGSDPDFVEEQSHKKDDDHHLHFFDPRSKRWPKPEVHALIKLRIGLDERFQEPGPKAALWEDISLRMSNLGYPRSGKRCKEKWENINKYFKKAKESNKLRPENSKTCPYFHELDDLYGKGLLRQKQFGGKVDDHSEESNKQEDSDHADAGGGSDTIFAITAIGETGNGGICRSREGRDPFPCSKDVNRGDQQEFNKTMHNVIDFSNNPNSSPAIGKTCGESNMKMPSISGQEMSIMADLEDKHNTQAPDRMKLVHAQSLSEEYDRMEVEDGDRRQGMREEQQLQYVNESAPSSTYITIVERFNSGAPDYRISVPTIVD